MYRYDLDEKNYSFLTFTYGLLAEGAELFFRWSNSGRGVHIFSEKPIPKWVFCQGFEEIAEKRGVRIMFVDGLLPLIPITDHNLFNIFSRLRDRGS